MSTIFRQKVLKSSVLKKGEKCDFETMFLALENRIHAVVTFLALLELLNAQEVVLIQGEGMNNFWLTLN
jgi:segregation and condensation protein A